MFSNKNLYNYIYLFSKKSSKREVLEMYASVVKKELLRMSMDLRRKKKEGDKKRKLFS
jgi:hypothetical protein